MSRRVANIYRAQPATRSRSKRKVFMSLGCVIVIFVAVSSLLEDPGDYFPDYGTSGSTTQDGDPKDSGLGSLLDGAQKSNGYNIPSNNNNAADLGIGDNDESPSNNDSSYGKSLATPTVGSDSLSGIETGNDTTNDDKSEETGDSIVGSAGDTAPTENEGYEDSRDYHGDPNGEEIVDGNGDEENGIYYGGDDTQGEGVGDAIDQTGMAGMIDDNKNVSDPHAYQPAFNESEGIDANTTLSDDLGSSGENNGTESFTSPIVSGDVERIATHPPTEIQDEEADDTATLNATNTTAANEINVTDAYHSGDELTNSTLLSGNETDTLEENDVEDTSSDNSTSANSTLSDEETEGGGVNINEINYNTTKSSDVGSLNSTVSYEDIEGDEDGPSEISGNSTSLSYLGKFEEETRNSTNSSDVANSTLSGEEIEDDGDGSDEITGNTTSSTDLEEEIEDQSKNNTNTLDPTGTNSTLDDENIGEDVEGSNESSGNTTSSSDLEEEIEEQTNNSTNVTDYRVSNTTDADAIENEMAKINVTEGANSTQRNETETADDLIDTEDAETDEEGMEDGEKNISELEPANEENVEDDNKENANEADNEDRNENVDEEKKKEPSNNNEEKESAKDEEEENNDGNDGDNDEEVETEEGEEIVKEDGNVENIADDKEEVDEEEEEGKEPDDAEEGGETDEEDGKQEEVEEKEGEDSNTDEIKKNEEHGEGESATDEKNDEALEETSIEEDENYQPCSSNPFASTMSESVEELSTRAKDWLIAKNPNEMIGGEGGEDVEDVERKLETGVEADTDIVLANCISGSVSALPGLCGDLNNDENASDQCDYFVAVSRGISEGAAEEWIPVFVKILQGTRCNVHVASLCGNDTESITKDKLVEEEQVSTLEDDVIERLVVHENACLSPSEIEKGEDETEQVEKPLLQKSERVEVDLLYILNANDSSIPSDFVHSLGTDSLFLMSSDEENSGKVTMPMHIVFHNIKDSKSLLHEDDIQIKLLSMGYALVASQDGDHLSLIRFSCPAKEPPMGGSAIFTGAGFPV